MQLTFYAAVLPVLCYRGKHMSYIYHAPQHVQRRRQFRGSVYGFEVAQRPKQAVITCGIASTCFTAKFLIIIQGAFLKILPFFNSYSSITNCVSARVFISNLCSLYSRHTSAKPFRCDENSFSFANILARLLSRQPIILTSLAFQSDAHISTSANTLDKRRTCGSQYLCFYFCHHENPRAVCFPFRHTLQSRSARICLRVAHTYIPGLR
jgi:hypothetical protein